MIAESLRRVRGTRVAAAFTGWNFRIATQWLRVRGALRRPRSVETLMLRPQRAEMVLILGMVHGALPRQLHIKGCDSFHLRGVDV